MNQTQRPSRKAESFSFGVELELLLPQTAINDLGIRIGGYHAGYPLPAPFPQGWTAERDASLHTSRQGYVPVEIVSPVLRGRAGIEQVKQVAQTLKELGARVNVSTGLHYVEPAIMLSDGRYFRNAGATLAQQDMAPA